jgi:presenilin-like A22 family membrane protease
MKHNTKITTILISMFIITQIIGLFVIIGYSNGLLIPYGMEPPEEVQQQSSFFTIIISFAIALGLFLLLIKLKAESFIRLWFFVVTSIALGLTINVMLFYSLRNFNVDYIPYLALMISVPLAYFKVFRRNMNVHNFTELLIYPGIAAVFIPLLGVLGIIILLLLISVYDIWAVWHSEVMQKMAKFQINNLKFFTGFFIPYASKKDKMKMNEIKEKYSDKDEKFLSKKIKALKIKISLAILGGGDVVFPIIAAGVFYKVYDSIIPALIISLFASLALLLLFVFAEKKKFYPAMPFITIGIYLGMILDWILMNLGII